MEEAEEYRNRCNKLEVEIVDANKKFNECILSIEEAKEKERSLYEESIVRLLTNIEKRDTFR